MDMDCKVAGSYRGFKRYDSVSFISPEGVIHRDIQNINNFCKVHGLYQSNVSNMISGKFNHVAGWRVYSVTIDGVEYLKELKEYTLSKPREPNRVVAFISPSGKIFEGIRNVSAFCKLHGLYQSHVTAIILGKRSQTKGWRVHSVTYENTLPS